MSGELSDAGLGHRLMEFEGRFRRAGGVDLIVMSAELPAELFREYIELSREWRARRRK
jgi:hypothetical protein